MELFVSRNNYHEINIIEGMKDESVNQKYYKDEKEIK